MSKSGSVLFEMPAMLFFRFSTYTAVIFLVFLAWGLACHAGDRLLPVCEMVGQEQLRTLYPRPLYPGQQKNGCRWSETPGGKAYFQIGIIESHKDLRQFFDKKIPAGYRLKKLDDLGDRGLCTETKGCYSVIAVREGGWVLISTVDLLYIRQGETRQKVLWDIYREILHGLE